MLKTVTKQVTRNLFERRTRRQIELRAEQLRQTGKKTAVLLGFSSWKTFFPDFMSDYNVVRFGTNINTIRKAQVKNIYRFPDPSVFVWSYKYPPFVIDYCNSQNVVIFHVEDGFIRSFGLGAARTRPLSLVFDQQGMHFDGNRRTDLEDILNSYDFAAAPTLIERAERLRDTIVSNGLSKYNFTRSAADIDDIIGGRCGRERVLVIGQVEDDLSVQFGMEQRLSNNELVLRTADAYPSAQILYRPHPETLQVRKPHYSDPLAVAYACRILPPSLPIADCLDAADRVVTMTSLVGFEAALRGKSVEVLGTPFYAGWGFTDDARTFPRRRRTLTPVETLAGAYILYARYFHPVYGSPIEVEDAVGMIQAAIRSAALIPN